MSRRALFLLAALLAPAAPAPAQKAKPPALSFPPKLPAGQPAVSDTAPAFLDRPAGIAKEVAVARAIPTVELLYFPGQDYAGRPWSVWGEGSFAGGTYYTAIGDHLAPAGNAFVYAYDPVKKTLTRIVDVRKTLALPDGHYTPGKIHTRLDLASDGWLYFATHRGSTRATTDANKYQGDWIMRHHPATGKTEVVCRGPVGKHCIPVGITDAKRLVFYGATAPGVGGEEEGKFFAYDLKDRKLLHEVADGPARAIALSPSTGKVFYTRRSDGKLMRLGPTDNKGPVAIPGTIGLRAASAESPAGVIYAVSQGRDGAPAKLYALDVKTEKVADLGPAAVGAQQYITALALDARGRYLYYCPGAHGNADRDGTPIVQYDTRTKTRKVIAFLAKHYTDKYGLTPRGSYALALDARGERLFITWNVSRGGRNWDCCALSVVTIPEAERKP